MLVGDEICNGGMDEVDWLAEIPWRAREGEKRRAEGTGSGRAASIYMYLCVYCSYYCCRSPVPGDDADPARALLRSDGTLGWAAIAGRRATCLLGARLSERVTIYGVHGLARVRPPVGPAWSDVPAFP